MQTVYAANPNDDRPIGGSSTGAYDFSQIPFDDDIDFETNLDEVALATFDSSHLDSVK